MKIELTAARLRELLHYDPETGVFTRLVNWPGVNPDLSRKRPGSNGYIRFDVDGVRYYAHRLAWLYVYGEWPRGDVDHINHDRADNRIANLRDVTRSVNMENQIAARGNNRSSGVLGVSWHKKASKWGACIQVGGRNRHLGLFAEKEAASAAYLEAKRANHEGCTI